MTSEEKRQSKNKHQRDWYASLPEESRRHKQHRQKLYMREYMARRKASETPEEREARKAYAKAYRARRKAEDPDYERKVYAAHREDRKRRSSEYAKTHRETVTAASKRWRAANPEKERLRLHKQRLKRYNLSVTEFEEMTAAQDGRCAICRRESKLCVDHDHATGAVRGLLCNRCNRFLGVLEKWESLNAAQDYLAKHRAREEAAE